MARTQYYVDYGAGSDATGDGSIGTPWKTIQHALDNITRDATNGDTININSGTPQVLSAPLDNTTYGSGYAPWLAGYTSVAGDHGIGVIDGNGAANIWSSGPVSLRCQDVEFHNVTSYAFNFTTSTGGGLTLIYCYGHDIGDALVRSRAYVTAIASSFVNVGGNFLAGISGNLYSFRYCYFDGCDTIGANTEFNMRFAHCLFVQTRVYNWNVGSDGFEVIGCTFYNVSPYAIRFRNATAGFYQITNNIFHTCPTVAFNGLSVGPGDGYLYGHNKFYNCGAPWSNKVNTIFHYVTEDDEVLSSDPLPNAASGDYAPAAGVQDGAWPIAWQGLATTARGVDIGAVQAPVGGGNVIVIED